MTFSTTELSKDPQLNVQNELSALKPLQIQRCISWQYLPLHLHVTTAALIDYFLLFQMLFCSCLQNTILSRFSYFTICSSASFAVLATSPPHVYVQFLHCESVLHASIQPLDNFQSLGFICPEKS